MNLKGSSWRIKNQETKNSRKSKDFNEKFSSGFSGGYKISFVDPLAAGDSTELIAKTSDINFKTKTNLVEPKTKYKGI